jgi:glycosyltransferase involved in cell wall biosynthesis
MKIVVTGTRGIPNIQGGIETHCEELFPRISKLGFDINLVRRSCYISPNEAKLKEFNGVKLFTIYAPHLKSLEAFLHTLLTVIWARKQKADVVHIHGIGPALMAPLARILGLKVVFTHHGSDYDRAKWGHIAKLILKIGERSGAFSANEIIVISDLIRQTLIKKYNRKDTNLIFNGVNRPIVTANEDFIKKLDLKSRNYVFTLGRFVEEKGFDLLIKAFSKINQGDCRLVIAGDSDHETAYSKRLKELAKEKNVVLTGFIKGEKLQELYCHARLFVLPSYHEGLPISLLEAMSYSLPVLVSDIPANKQIAIPRNRFFITGSENSLIENLEQQLLSEFKPVIYDMSSYNWDHIARQTVAVYEKLKK